MKSSLVAIEGEEVLAVLKGEMFSTSTNFLVNIIMKIIQFLMFITCRRIQGQMMVTNKRIVVESKYLVCCCVPWRAVFKSIPYQGVSSVQYGFETVCCCCCRKYALTVTQNSGTSFGFVMKDGEEEASNFVNLILSNIKQA